MTPVQKSDTYGKFFCEKKSERLNKVMWDMVFSTASDPLYVQLYNSQINTVESLSLRVILEDLVFNYLYPFPDKPVNNCNQINLYGFYFVSSSIYYLIQEYWDEIATNGFCVSTGCNQDENYNEKNKVNYQEGFYMGVWNMEGAYMNPCVESAYMDPCVESA